IGGDVRVAVDDAGNYVLIGGIDDLRPGRFCYRRADFGDLAVPDQDGAFERPLGHRHDGGILDDIGLGAQGRRGQESCAEKVLHDYFTPGSEVAPRVLKDGASAAGTYLRPSTIVISTLVRSSKKSAAGASKLGVFPFSDT